MYLDKKVDADECTTDRNIRCSVDLTHKLNDVSLLVFVAYSEILGCPESSCNWPRNASLEHLISVILKRADFY